MTSSRGANIPSESTRSFSKHMHVVDTLTSTSSPPTHALLPTFYTPAGSLSPLCARMLRSYVSCSRDVHAWVAVVLVSPLQRAPGMRLCHFPPLLSHSWWMNGSKTQRDAHFSTATFGHWDSLAPHGFWTLRQVVCRSMGGLGFCVCQWRRDEWLRLVL